MEVMMSPSEKVIKLWHLAGMLIKVRGFPVESSALHTATLPFQKVLEPEQLNARKRFLFF